jgi:hypothetical protein
MSATTFDDLDNSSAAGNEHSKPFFAIPKDDDRALLDWFDKTTHFLKEINQQRFNRIKNNYARYKGIQYRDQIYTPRDLPEKKTRYMPQMVIPLIADAVDEKVSRLLEYKPSVQAIPHNDEQKDKIAAKTAKKFLGHVEQAEDLDKKFQVAVKSSKIAGESFVFCLWDYNKGRMIVKPGEKMTGSKGQEIVGPIYEGDVSIENEAALNCLYEKAKSWDKVEYIFRFGYEYTEKLKVDYPEVADKITSSRQVTYYDFETMDLKSLEGMTSVITFYHKATKYLPEGYECKYVNDQILAKGPLSFKHGDLPVVRFVDVENEEELSGESFIEKTKAMASQVNNNLNMAIKQLMLCAHPKWAVDSASVSDQDLGNDTGIIHLKPGSRQPQLMQSNPVSQQLLDMTDRLEEKYLQMTKSNSIVRGEPPAGVTAFVALQFLSEAENRRLSTDLANVNKAIKDVYDQALKICAQRYKKNDKRTMMIMGKDNRWTYAFLDPEDLASPFSLVLQNSSALPESKALRTQFVLDMGKTFPEQFPPSQIAEMLDLGQSEKLMDIASGAARAAEDENEMILDGKMMPDPEIHEDLITHWNVHVSAIQDVGFKMKSEDDIQEAMRNHIMATEMLMMDSAMKDASFAAKISARCPQFPLYMTPMQAPPPMMDQGMAQDPSQMGVDLDAAPDMGPMQGGAPQPSTKSPEQTGVSKALELPIR